ncbi:hypothetical protein M3181_22145 [Mesobacillus maritimus]|uniref:hypothetical protein n=1 Tax=Mesobacillus maritimus TaxID=1643336 RepID=UPI00203F2B6B|nr:hypothetical protein [Mesobacillus maritimus]MCM3671661.1 hypothetical protein [Mesobacillus maritimus]
MKWIFRNFKNTKFGKIFLGAISFIALVMLPALIEESYSLNNLLSIPLDLLADWETTGTLSGRVKFVLLLLVYLPSILFIILLIFSIFGRKSAGNEPYQSNYDYGKLIAELSSAVNDRTTSGDLTTSKVHILFNALIDDICKLYNIERNHVRAVIVRNERGNQKLTGWRWGRSITEDQERMDLKAIATLLETEKTYPTWEQVKKQFVNGDSETLFFIRNTGNELKLGVLIAVSKQIDTEEHIDEWAQLVYPFTMLGHMDKLVKYVVNYR